MKCFFSFKQSKDKAHNYAQLLKVAVHSAQKNTDLDLYCLFDGQPNELTNWLESRNVNVIFRRSFLYSKIESIAIDKLKNDSILEVGAGAFLRLEIPSIMQEYNYNDQFVLYTDCDVMFRNNIVEKLCSYRPKFFSVAPENDITNYRMMNSGVMLMNVKNLQTNDAKFRQFVEENVEHYIPSLGKPIRPNVIKHLLNKRVRYFPTWDQSAYQRFYTRNWLGVPAWDKLPPSFNWKPYWGQNTNADIVHFHGPKPNQVHIFKSDDVPVHFRILSEMTNEAYFEYSQEWNKLWEEIK